MINKYKILTIKELQKKYEEIYGEKPKSNMIRTILIQEILKKEENKKSKFACNKLIGKKRIIQLKELDNNRIEITDEEMTTYRITEEEYQKLPEKN